MVALGINLCVPGDIFGPVKRISLIQIISLAGGGTHVHGGPIQR